MQQKENNNNIKEYHLRQIAKAVCFFVYADWYYKIHPISLFFLQTNCLLV